MMRVLIVDDEPPALSELRVLLNEAGDIDIVGEAGNAVEAIAAINRLQPEVVFLDIQMPRITGLEMLTMLDPVHPPRIVFLTAHDDYAVQAFEENAFDYLLKPVDPARLGKTLQRLQRDRAPQDVGTLKRAHPLRQIPCTGQNRISLLRVEDVEYVASRPSGVYVVGEDGKERFTELSLRTLEERTSMFQCHRQYLVNLDRIKELRFEEGGLGHILTLAGRSVPVSRRFLSLLKEKLGVG
ncbi:MULTISPECIES: two-component system response regulator BtsR [Rhodopseudomonas]|uniref:Two-component response-regulatory protein YehT n=1 Tax=Rhodopseudomonas palustris TaxID=1076 RepID=A0A0D7DZ49_RHOPL|nr:MULTISPECIES: two-component system response regulator BtsR [Rhodopseudomonas]KIZ33834.1 two-component response-regulatory protein YehT [Rhodopseudomonas palustris]MDF3809870.1 two-component system response regulator BtsR [Rhodopseudomonas sp. BAL398]WOK17727.1 two-component system response regulator BtsR [Rhodopseudomonas sp. BAL398]